MSSIDVFYIGDQAKGVVVREGDKKRALDPRLDLGDETSSDLTWGYETPEGSRLPLALLADALGDDDRALKLRHAFGQRVLKLLPARWTITRTRILAYVREIEQSETTIAAFALTREIFKRKAA